jgi:hypothetical protein
MCDMLIADLEGDALVLMAGTCPSCPRDDRAKRGPTDTTQHRDRGPPPAGPPS